MKTVLAFYETVIQEKLKFFFALSRTHHGVLDMMSPILIALLYLGAFPELNVVIAGIITVFSGYTCIYALNDIAGYGDDKNNIGLKSEAAGLADLDSMLIQHPVAQGRITIKEAALWAGFWGVTAILGAWYLNPFCVVIFLAGAMLEALYCALLKVSYLRIIISCFVKSAGPVAAVFAVDPSPDSAFVFIVLIFHFLWEAGGQNIPNDYADIDGDTLVKAKTLAIKFGPGISSVLILVLVICAALTAIVLFVISPADFGPLSYVMLIAGSVFLLIWPARSLVEKQGRNSAMGLFNRASYYPVFLLCVVLMNLSF